MERYSYSVDVDYILSQNPLIYGLHSFRNLGKVYTTKDEDFYELCNAYVDLYESPSWDFITYNSRGEAMDAMPEVVQLAKEKLLISLMDDLIYKLRGIYRSSLSPEPLTETGKISTTLYDGNEYPTDITIYLDVDGFTDDTYSTYEAYQIIIVFNAPDYEISNKEFKFRPSKDRLQDVIDELEDLCWEGTRNRNK